MPAAPRIFKRLSELLNDAARAGIRFLRLNADGSRSERTAAEMLADIGAYGAGGTDVAVADGGTGTSTGSITGTTALTFAAGGTAQNVNITPSTTGFLVTTKIAASGAIQSNGQAQLSSAYVVGQYVALGSGGSTVWQASNGVINLTNSALDSFTRLNLGPATSSFPALKRSTTIIQVRLADDSAFTDIGLRGLLADRTDTAAATTGAQTINKAAGSVNFAAAATSLVVTNSLVTTASRVLTCVNTNDTTMFCATAVSAAGSFTLRPDAAPTAETNVSFFVLNP